MIGLGGGVISAPAPFTITNSITTGYVLTGVSASSASWQPSGGGGSGVTTFNGRSGVVVPTSGDYTASEVTYSNTVSGLTSVDAQDAIDELNSLRPTDIANAVTQARSGMVLSTRQVLTTSPLTGGGNLSADLTLGISGVVLTTRNVNTGAGLAGGGSLAGDLTLTAQSASSFMKPTGSLRETYSRLGALPANQSNALVSGQLQFMAIVLYQGEIVTSLSFQSGTVPASLPLNQWFGLWDASFNQLKLSSDDTSTAWAANTVKTLTLSGGTYTAPTTGLYYASIMVNATTVPGLYCINGNTNVMGITPLIAARDTTHTGLTTPASAPATATAASNANEIYGWLS